jgi:hypothetical protein
LPAVCGFEAFQTVRVGMNVLQLTNVDEVLCFYETGEEFKVIGDVGLLWTQGEVLFLC